MRPYPEDNPGDEFVYLTRHKSGAFSECYWSGKHWQTMTSASIIKTVTHFALPSDITTADAVPKGVVAWADEDGNSVSAKDMNLAKDRAELGEAEQVHYEILSSRYTVPLGVLPFDAGEGVREALQAAEKFIAGLTYYEPCEFGYKSGGTSITDLPVTDSDFKLLGDPKAPHVELLAVIRAALSGRQAATWRGVEDEKQDWVCKDCGPVNAKLHYIRDDEELGACVCRALPSSPELNRGNG